jgi:hypothetical protein
VRGECADVEGIQRDEQEEKDEDNCAQQDQRCPAMFCFSQMNPRNGLDYRLAEWRKLLFSQTDWRGSVLQCGPSPNPGERNGIVSRYELPTYSSNARRCEPVGCTFRERLQQDEHAAAVEHERHTRALATGAGE